MQFGIPEARRMSVYGYATVSKRIGQYENLSAIRRIRHCLGITHHPGVENHLAGGCDRRAKVLTQDHGAICKDELSRLQSSLLPKGRILRAWSVSCVHER